MALKQGEQNIRKLAKVGGNSSYSITLPVGAVREFGWKEGQKLSVTADKKGKRFIVKDLE